MRPSGILLNISREPFLLDEGIDPKQVMDQHRDIFARGLVTLNVTANTGPYRKLLPSLALLGREDALIATVDDDVFYPPHWLRALHACASLDGFTSICAPRCRRIPEGGLAAGIIYNDWPLLRDDAEGDQPRLDALPIGREGILYRTTFFDDLPAMRRMMDDAPMQDDLAFRRYTMMRGILVRRVPRSALGVSHRRFDGIDYSDGLGMVNSATLSPLGVTLNDMAWIRLQATDLRVKAQ